jgi:signal transduction histidine kinase
MSEAAAAHLLTPLPRVSILLVDDVPANLFALEAVLEPLGHRLVRASSGDEALRKLLQEDFALILMDGQMPGLDGFQTAAIIKQRERTRDIPLMFISAVYRDLGFATKGYAIGAVDYVIKPFEPDLMRAKVAAIIAEYHRRERLKEQARALLAQERRLLAEQSARQAAEAANHLKDEFIAMVSHELRTPLNAIVGWTELMRAGRVAPDAMAKAIDAIHRNANAQRELIEDLLDVSRIVSGNLRLNRATCDVAEVVTTEAEAARRLAAERAITVAATTQPCLAVCDGERLHQIVSNLVGNAVKFSVPSGRVEIHLQTEGDHFELRVVDSGAGIPTEFLSHIFEPFWQAEQSSTRRRGGLGLGLAIVRRLVELHGGTISASSEGPGKGACFTVRMPMQAVDRITSIKPALVRAANDAQLDGVRILVVDDETDARDLLGALLEDAGAKVTVAQSVATALEAIEHGRYDILLSDLAMPEEDGFNLIEQVRGSHAKSLPALVLSAHSDEETVQRARAAGFADFVAKPFNGPALVTRIAQLTSRRPS